MTCIVAVEYPGGVIMGADSFLGDSGGVVPIATPKIVRRPGLAIGYCGGLLVPTWLASVELPKPRARETSERYVLSLAMQLRATAQERKIVIEYEGALRSDTDMLIAVRGEAWVIDAEFACYRSAHRYIATGAGCPFALGALHALSPRYAPSAKEARSRVLGALAAATELCAYVRKPFHVVEVPA